MTKEDFGKRLDELSKLEKGWFDGEGEAISSTTITSAIYLVKRLAAFGMAFPHIFPTPEGGISLEWDNNFEYGIEITIDPEGVTEIFY